MSSRPNPDDELSKQTEPQEPKDGPGMTRGQYWRRVIHFIVVSSACSMLGKLGYDVTRYEVQAIDVYATYATISITVFLIIGLWAVPRSKGGD
jgi:hypothetical protein